MLGLAGASKWEQELETWLGEDLTKALLDTWEQKRLNTNVMKVRSENLLRDVAGKDFTFF
jgi:hypothetical protein